MTDEPFFLTVAGISMSFAVVAYAVATLFAALTAIPAAALSSGGSIAGRD